jgi:hypothetical protein
LHADDSLETVASLLTFLTLRPGDTDADYFAGYTPAQMEWATGSDCEALQCDLGIAMEDNALADLIAVL